GGLPRAGVGRGDLHVRGEADAELPDVAVRAPAGLLPAELVVARRGQDLVQRLGVPAGVVQGAGLGLEGEPVRRDEVAPPDYGRVNADLGGEQVERVPVDADLGAEAAEAFGLRPFIGHVTRVAAGESIVNPDGSATASGSAGVGGSWSRRSGRGCR